MATMEQTVHSHWYLLNNKHTEALQPSRKGALKIIFSWQTLLPSVLLVTPSNKYHNIFYIHIQKMAMLSLLWSTPSNLFKMLTFFEDNIKNSFKNVYNEWFIVCEISQSNHSYLGQPLLTHLCSFVFI